MDRALGLLSSAIEQSEILMAVAPIRYISFGGTLAVKVFQNRENTEDVDILLDPNLEALSIYYDEIQHAISTVTTKGGYENDWFNDACRLFTAREKRPKLFLKSVQQNIAVYRSSSLVVYAASFEYALERKLRRMDSNSLLRDRSIDLSDTVALIHALRDTHPLSRDYVQELDLNECGTPVENKVVSLVAKEYLEKYQQQGIVEMIWDEEGQCHTYTNLQDKVVSVPRNPHEPLYNEIIGDIGAYICTLR
ncbi:hypothetical protein E0Z10_g129 [Xylaria hypoxylon]|uniref:Uncharacterized protein n=1 Tax=Xylaria hypoxylon TaxID=37992 RepID=A0A4Z0ZAL4_9PEZI|nr:hypothetical protein E0Z10_g129 [Xylaria hypoxylon]